MSALAEQHERWTGARERLMNSPEPPPRVKPPTPRSPFVRHQIAKALEQVKVDPAVAIVFPNLHAEVAAEFPPASVIMPDPAWKTIANEVCQKHGVSLDDLRSPRRDVRSVKARHEAFWRCRHETGYSLPQIGYYFGGRDHTTVLHGIRKHEERMAEAK